MAANQDLPPPLDGAFVLEPASVGQFGAFHPRACTWRPRRTSSPPLQSVLSTVHYIILCLPSQGLYLAAMEELARLDKENTELKDMIQGQVFELTHSR